MPTGLRWERGTDGRTWRRFERSTGETVAVHAPINIYEDFLGVKDSDLAIPQPWNLCLGSDAQAAVALTAVNGGALAVTTGNNSGTASDDIVMVNLALNFLPGSLYDLNFEAKIRMATSVATGTMGFGFTDVLSTTGSTEEPSSISATTLTTNATDAVGLIYDTAATNDYWHYWGVNTDVDSMFASTGVAPVADTYNILRCQISNGRTAKLWIDGVLVKEQATALANVALTPYVYFNATTTASIVGAIDYLRVWAAR